MAPEVLPDIPEVVNYLTPQGSMAQGCYKLTTDHRPPTTDHYPVTPKEPWVNLLVARATRRIPPTLTGCVLTQTAWEHTGAASGFSCAGEKTGACFTWTARI